MTAAATRAWGFTILFAVGGAVPWAYAQGQPPPAHCGCPAPHDPAVPAGIAWQSAGPPPDLPGIATLLAPVLWFSSDEPLIVLREQGPLPHAHPNDVPAGSAIVYYQATDLVLRGGDRVSGTGEADPQFFNKVDHSC